MSNFLDNPHCCVAMGSVMYEIAGGSNTIKLRKHRLDLPSIVDRRLMPKVLAFLSYGLNAGLMLGIALLLAKSLSPAEYSRYSFAVATAQTLVVCIFEWLRIAAMRHYPGPNPVDAPTIRHAFLGGQYALGICTVLFAAVFAIATSDLYWFLIGFYAVSWGVLDLHLTMLRFDEQLPLFSKLQTFRGFVSLLVIVSAAFFFRHSSAALLAAIFANILTTAALETVRPGFVFVAPSLRQIGRLRQVASYGISAAIAGGLYQIGPFLMRCVAFRSASDISYAAFSLVSDLMQRPYNVVLTASNGAFFPDAVREHDRSPDSDNSALRLLYAIDAWCLLMTFGCTIAFRNELIPLLIKSELLPHVLQVFSVLSAFFLIHAAILNTCAISAHLYRSGSRLIFNAALELGGIVGVIGLWTSFVGSDIFSVACSGAVGAAIGFLLTCAARRRVPCQLPWASWTAAFLTASILICVGQTNAYESLAGVALKGLVTGPIIVIGGLVGFAIPFGLIERFNERKG